MQKGLPLKTWVAFLKHDCNVDAVAIGEKDAWLRMCGKHWIVSAQSKDAALDKAETLWLDEQGVPQNSAKRSNIVTHLR